MKIPPGATTYVPPPRTIGCGAFSGKSHRHTVRAGGTKDWLLIYTLGGFGLHRHEGGELRVAGHDITLYRPGAFQDYRRDPNASRWDLVYAHFSPRSEWFPWLEWPEVAPGFFHMNLSGDGLRLRVVRRLQEALRLSWSAEVRRETFGMNALEEVLLWCDSVNPRRAKLRTDPRVQRAMDYLIVHCEEPFSPEKIARASGLSASRLRHIFREQAGVALRDFQEQQRLRKARDLLRLSSLTVGEISRRLGFENPFYFSLRFKKHAGESPRAFRRRELG